jgi:hypothetical protein
MKPSLQLEFALGTWRKAILLTSDDGWRTGDDHN